MQSQSICKAWTQGIWVASLRGEKKDGATLCEACIEKKKIFTELGEHRVNILLFRSSQEKKQ